MVDGLPVAARVLAHCLEDVMLVAGDESLVSGVLLSRWEVDLCDDIVDSVLRLPSFLIDLFAAGLAETRNDIERVGRKMSVTISTVRQSQAACAQSSITCTEN